MIKRGEPSEATRIFRVTGAYGYGYPFLKSAMLTSYLTNL